MHFRETLKLLSSPEDMANTYLREYFGEQKIEYPINPFKMLKDEGILFSFRDFNKLEGVYIPSAGKDDVPIVGVNINRPITRQRFTAAHELCHHFRDADKEVVCPTGGRKSKIEKFADDFAAALLMPLSDLGKQVNKRKNKKGYISFDDVLEIAHYFGVSFESCLFRIAYRLHAIDGDTESSELKRRIKEYKPDKKRESKHMTYTRLYVDLFDSFSENLRFEPSKRALLCFQNNYMYNDSRLEGLNITIEEASERVTDLRLNMQNSKYCSEDNEAFMSIAGHYAMYQEILSSYVKDKTSVFEMVHLNKMLFAYYPNPEFGGATRQNNALVLGSKFETIDYEDIGTELSKLDIEVNDYYSRRTKILLSEYIEHIVRVHHRITVIHPFPEGNGRTARAFMNIQLVRVGVPPIYVKIEEKKKYIDALSLADKTGNYDELYELVFKLIMRSYAELS